MSNIFEKIIYDHGTFSQPGILWIQKSTFNIPFSEFYRNVKEFDSGTSIGTILMDFPKAYDFLRHDLSIARLEAYGLGNGSLNVLLDYLTFRKQRTKVGSAYSKWSKIRRAIPQGSILRPILFNIFINDIFMIIEQSDICNFADNKTL